jgi:hypothetical protein
MIVRSLASPDDSRVGLRNVRDEHSTYALFRTTGLGNHEYAKTDTRGEREAEISAVTETQIIYKMASILFNASNITLITQAL